MPGLVSEGWHKKHQKYKKENWVVCKIERFCNYHYEMKQLKVQGHLNQTILACNLVYSYRK